MGVTAGEVTGPDCRYKEISSVMLERGYCPAECLHPDGQSSADAKLANLKNARADSILNRPVQLDFDLAWMMNPLRCRHLQSDHHLQCSFDVDQVVGLEIFHHSLSESQLEHQPVHNVAV